MRTASMIMASIAALALLASCGRDDAKAKERAEKAEARAEKAEKRVEELEKKLAAERKDDKKADDKKPEERKTRKK